MTIDASKNTSGVVVTAVATTSPDIESQQKQQSSGITAPTNTSTSTGNPDEGKTLGIVMFVLLIIAFITTFVVPILAFVCLIAAIVISSAIACGCCCASDYKLQPNIKKFSTATLVSLILMFVVQIVWLIGAAAAIGTEASSTGTVSQSTAEATTISALIVFALSLVFNVMAIIFSALFTWGRGIGAQRS